MENGSHSIFDLKPKYVAKTPIEQNFSVEPTKRHEMILDIKTGTISPFVTPTKTSSLSNAKFMFNDKRYQSESSKPRRLFSLKKVRRFNGSNFS